MKRNMDLIRKILLEIEKLEGDEPLTKIKINGYRGEDIAYQVYLLQEAGLIDAYLSFVKSRLKPNEFYIYKLTWAGHDFLDACRDESRWNKAKKMAAKMGSSVTFDVMKSLLGQLMMSQIPKLIASGV